MIFNTMRYKNLFFGIILGNNLTLIYCLIMLSWAVDWFCKKEMRRKWLKEFMEVMEEYANNFYAIILYLWDAKSTPTSNEICTFYAKAEIYCGINILTMYFLFPDPAKIRAREYGWW